LRTVRVDVCVIRYGDLCLAIDAQFSGLNRPKLDRCVCVAICLLWHISSLCMELCIEYALQFAANLKTSQEGPFLLVYAMHLFLLPWTLDESGTGTPREPAAAIRTPALADLCSSGAHTCRTRRRLVLWEGAVWRDRPTGRAVLMASRAVAALPTDVIDDLMSRSREAARVCRPAVSLSFTTGGMPLCELEKKPQRKKATEGAGAGQLGNFAIK
jgi:hypothetical protein